MSSIVLRAGGTRPAPPALAGAVHEATRSGAGMRMEEAQVKLRSSDCAVFFHMWFATKCHEAKYSKSPPPGFRERGFFGKAKIFVVNDRGYFTVIL